ncbi:glycosyltransferase family 2 protein [uncultured Paracoccus sp.]|uniref:glycosyltransferase family 2 protein n=1 Tax=uncultured Paracoccus sp. TaxID=189685 RepID=UPI0025FC09D0|nr:glycosyltransferase family 2 protein [uncultured Paracoccus sp.]
MQQDVKPQDVSIVIPARNAAATLAQTLQPILDQDRLAEIVVIDDGSADGTARIAAAFEDPCIRTIPGPCIGIADALNAGFRAASAPYVARCDAYDLFLPGRLDCHSAHMAISGGFVSIDHKGRRLAGL